MNKLERYIELHSSAGTEADNALLAELDRATNLRAIQPKMVSGRVQGAFLTLITRMLRPQLVLEIGTFTGYSALSIAAGLGKEDEEFQIAAGFWENDSEIQIIAGSEDEEAYPLDAESREGDSEFPIAAGSSKSPEIHTVEIDDELEYIAREFFARSPHGHKIHMHIGSALEVVPKLARRLGRPFDMVFIDGDKREYPAYYQMLMGVGVNSRDGGQTHDGECIHDRGSTHDHIHDHIHDPTHVHPHVHADENENENRNGNRSACDTKSAPMVRSGTIILTDNVLWYGKVVEPDAVKQADRMSQGIMEFNRMVAADPRVENVILPLRDGINLIRVK